MADRQPLRQQRRLQQFAQAWLEDEDLRPWLQPVDGDPTKAYCRVCVKQLTAHHTTLVRHMTSQMHNQRLVAVQEGNLRPAEVEEDVEGEDEEAQQLTLAQSIKRAELMLTAFYVDNGYSFNSSQNLAAVCCKAFPDSAIASNLHLKRSKMRAMTVNVLGKSHKEIVQGILNCQKFSILVDETTDISTEKSACILVRYYDELKNKVLTSLWDLVPIYNEVDAVACAAHLYQLICDSFVDSGISLDNIIGYASDGCNTMMGANNSVASRFLENCPGITVMKCLCHSIHLCASKAAKVLPRDCENFCRLVHAYFTYSAKRQNELKEFQAFVDAEIHKILKLSSTRWLVLKQVVDRILQQWGPLTHYFNRQWLELTIPSAEAIYNHLNDPIMKCYLSFLNYIMTQFNYINEYFQTSKVVLPFLYEQISTFYINFLRCFMKGNAVNTTHFQEIDLDDESLYKPLNQIKVGQATLTVLNNFRENIGAEELEEFRTNVLKFYIRGAKEMRNRLDFGNVALKSVSCFQPLNALSDEFHDSFDFGELLQLFPRILLGNANNDALIDRIANGWDRLSIERLPRNIRDETSVTEFWRQIRDYRDPIGRSIFFDIGQFALDVLCLPHANADCEREFSILTFVKTKYRNRLSTKTVAGILHAKHLVENSNGMPSFIPNDNMINSCNASMYREQDDQADAQNADEPNDAQSDDEPYEPEWPQ